MRPSESKKNAAPVLVLGWVPRIVTAIARSLHRHGIAVDVVDFLSKPRIPSRAIREFARLPGPLFSSREFVSELRRYIARRGHDMLIPADDQALVAVMNSYEDIANLVHIGCPTPPVLNRVLDKTCTLKIAEACGIRVPRTVTITSSTELHDAISIMPFPWILKPAAKFLHEEERKSYRITSEDDIAKYFPVAWELPSPLILQEYCPGVGVGVEVLMQKNECVALFQHRRLKEFPYAGGFAVAAVAEKPDPELADSSLRLLGAMQWEGVAMVEYKVNDAGEPVLMEVNGRYWGTLSLAISAGVDFPWYEWKLAHGERPCVAGSYNWGTHWRWTAGYFARLHGLALAAKSNRSARKQLLRNLIDLPADFGFGKKDAMIELSDPLPGLVEPLNMIRYFAAQDVKALFQRWTPNVQTG